MARRKSDSPQKAAMREMMSVLLEGALDEELNEELGYSKYDYRNKETDNSRNGHSTWNWEYPKVCVNLQTDVR